MRFRYKASGRDGSLQEGIMEAASPAALERALRQRHLMVLEVQRLTPGAVRQRSADRPCPGPSSQELERGRPVLTERLGSVSWKGMERAIFLRQLQLMFSSGLPLHRAVESLAEGWDGRTREVPEALANLSRGLARGESFSQALLRCGLLRREQTVSLAVGEATGRLDRVLKALAQSEEDRWKIRCRVGAKLVYPCAVFALLLVGLAFTALLFSGRLSHGDPGAGGLLSSLGLALGLVPTLITAGYLGLPARRRSGYELTLRSVAEQWARTLPLIGRLVCYYEAGIVTKSLALGLDSGLPLDRCLQCLFDLPPSLTGREGLRRARRSLLQGAELEEVFGALPFLRADALALLAMGASAGRLPQALELSARYCDQEIEAAIEAGVALLVPVLIGALGLLVGLLMLVAFLPVYGQLSNL